MVEKTEEPGAAGAPAREALTVAELTSRISADRRGRRAAGTPRADRSGDGPVTVEQLLRREGRSDRRPASRSAEAPTARPGSRPSVPDRSIGRPVAPPPTFRNLTPAPAVAASRPPAAEPAGFRADASMTAPMPVVPKAPTTPPLVAAPPMAATSAPPMTPATPAGPVVGPTGTSVVPSVYRPGPARMPGPGQPASSPVMLPSVGPRAARNRSALRRPLLYGVVVAGAALFVGSVAATSAPQDRPLGPADLVPLADPTLPAAATGGGTLGAAATPGAPAAAPAAHVTTVDQAMPPLSPPLLGQRAQPLDMAQSSRPVVNTAAISPQSAPASRHAPSTSTGAPAQPGGSSGQGAAPADQSGSGNGARSSDSGPSDSGPSGSGGSGSTGSDSSGGAQPGGSGAPRGGSDDGSHSGSNSGQARTYSSDQGKSSAPGGSGSASSGKHSGQSEHSGHGSGGRHH